MVIKYTGRSRGRSKAIALLLAAGLGVAPVGASAFEPLSTMAVSLGTSLITKGLGWLFGKVVDSPDPHLEETRQIHNELRAVHQDILANRDLQITIHGLQGAEHGETRVTILEAEERIKAFFESQGEKERIVEVLAGVRHLTDLTDTVRRSEGLERVRGSRDLYTRFQDLQGSTHLLDYGEHLRAAMILPRISALQSQWAALSVLDNVDRARKDFVVRAGAWLELQRTRTGSRDPSSMTLSDLIENFERHLVGVDGYLGELADPCSALWKGYLMVTDVTETSSTFTIREVGVSLIRRRPERVAEAPMSAAHGSGRRLASSALARPTRLEWDHVVRKVPRPEAWEKSLDGRQLGGRLERLHDEVFDCPSGTERLARRELADRIPPLVDPRGGDGRSHMRPVRYDAFLDRTEMVSILPVDRLLARGSCADMVPCRRHWEFEHTRREIIAGLLAVLYGVRAKVNETLEWLADTSVGAKCTFLDDQPRVCVADLDSLPATAGVVGSDAGATPSPASLHGGAPSTLDPPGGTDPLDPYAVVRRFHHTPDALRVAATHERHAQQRFERAEVLGSLRRELGERSRQLAQAQQRNDDHLADVYREVARKAWIAFALSLVQDQIIDAVEAETEEFLTDLFLGGPTVKSKSAEATIAVVDVSGEIEFRNGSTTEDEEPESPGGSGTGLGVSGGKAPDQVLVAMTIPSDSSDSKGDGSDALARDIEQSSYGAGASLSAGQRLVLWLPPVPKEVGNFAVGVGDGVALGLTRLVRRWTGLSAQVDTDSLSYTNGTLVGSGILVGKAAKGVLAALKAGKAGAPIAKMGRFSVLLRLKGRSPGITVVNHARKGSDGRVFAFHVPNWRRAGRLATRLPHLHLGAWKAHLPWEPAWLLPAVTALAMKGDTSPGPSQSPAK